MPPRDLPENQYPPYELYDSSDYNEVEEEVDLDDIDGMQFNLPGVQPINLVADEDLDLDFDDFGQDIVLDENQVPPPIQIPPLNLSDADVDEMLNMFFNSMAPDPNVDQQ